MRFKMFSTKPVVIPAESGVGDMIEQASFGYVPALLQQSCARMDVEKERRFLPTLLFPRAIIPIQLLLDQKALLGKTFQHAMIADLVAVATIFPKLQLNQPILALGEDAGVYTSSSFAYVSGDYLTGSRVMKFCWKRSSLDETCAILIVQDLQHEKPPS